MKKRVILSIALSIFSLAIISSAIASPALAQGILPTPSGQGNCAGKNCGNYTLDDFMVLAVNISNWIIGIVGSITLLFFIYGGIMFTWSAGSEERVKKGKDILLNSVIGLAIVFTSFLIIQFIMSSLGFVKSERGQWSKMQSSTTWTEESEKKTQTPTDGTGTDQ